MGMKVLGVHKLLFVQVAASCRRTFSCAGKAYQSPARTRFAPSPTGSLHLGSLRTALYNYLWAKRTGGQFILRVEDTDQNRLSEGAERSLYDNLNWAGLDLDESPEKGGTHAPYRQSERLPIYHEHIKTLLDKGAAYRCFCSSERLAGLKDSARKHGQSGTYDRQCLAITQEESDSRARENEPHIIRLRSPQSVPIVEDVVHGTVNFSKSKQGITFDDSILIKSDGFPTYHFANVVDDHLMAITHVIRGEEWLPSTPKHLAIYDAFGWSPPQFAHVPLLASVGGAKLSKRHGDTTVEAYRAKGYLPEAMLNYLALMGWNAHIAVGESEVMSLEQMAERFELEQITKGATIVTSEKLQFLQKQHYHALSETEDGLKRLIEQAQAELQKTFGKTYDADYVGRVIVALRDRVVDPLGLPQLGIYFFTEPDYSSDEARKFVTKFAKKGTIPLSELLQNVHTKLSGLDERHWTGTEFNLVIERLFHETDFGTPNGLVMGAVRYAIAGGLSGAGVKQIMEIVGREKTLARLATARESLE
ncbi:Glutamyl-tRNA synthetase [Taphrina deformans PYCC 5710]|uniref:Glutamate--tRNA ligase, mitochondrial n=1 Tax=Taphrina deformans (strain PYCC 5710 / ATCC 11124 / CBS 356.35 / IMI 108563 / JCM 9778 / NBRC 8474) TaxID=1097556 RepID=R4X8J8_TAPDE|nr:Glutamyl-tRNA synthetase [Taphrina deformans PYCC 5710]|eukprot:CCG81944.1 Glutamyl-tRNA synthetase [Taphrina deformans PYCC 5710]